jgi:PIN domain nuclease of toxin-antitoxin system
VKLLLDTHIWIWSVLEPSKLSPRVAKELNDGSNECWLSPISIWELIVLVAKRRIILNLQTEEWIERALRLSRLKDAPLTAEVAIATRQVGLPHRDPADSFLVATAKKYGLTLVTSDERLLHVKGIAILRDS